MSEAVAVIPHADAPSTRQPFCTWAQDSRNYAIQIPPEVIASLGTESLVGFKRVPRRGLETGGILLGRAEEVGDTTTFWIEGFAAVESEHRFGPSYLLSDTDIAHFQKELTEKGEASLGIYRSQTRSEQLAIQNTDDVLFEKCFGIGARLFLMLAPVPRIAAFYFPEGGNLKCIHQFSLVSSLSALTAQGGVSERHLALPAASTEDTPSGRGRLARRSPDLAGPPAVASQNTDQDAALAEVSTLHAEPGGVPSEYAGNRASPAAYSPWVSASRRWATKLWSDGSGRSSGMKSRGWIVAAVTVTVLTAILLSYSFSRLAASDRQAPNYLYLTVEQVGPTLRLLWDGHSPAVRDATRAVLHIQDGDQQSDMELARSELLAGQFTYQPLRSTVSFRLKVYAGEPNAIGVVQVIFPPSPVAAATSVGMIPQSGQTSRPGSQPQVKPIAPPVPHTAEPPPTVQSNDYRGQNLEAKLDSAKWSDSPGSNSVASVRPPITREPSLSTPVEQPRGHAPRETVDVPTSGRDWNVHVSASLVPGSKLGRLFGKIPLFGHMRKQPKAVAAVPVYQARPTVRMPVNQQLIRPVAVGVKVYISESGSVEDAEVVDYGDGLNLTLANAALAAARNWTFEPPRIDDIPVASQAMLRFYFSP